MRDRLRGLLASLRAHHHLGLRHHPRCSYYDHHAVEVSGISLCMGCFVVYPVGFVSLVVLVALDLALAPFAGVPTWGLWAGGIALGTPIVATKLLERQGSATLAEVHYRVGATRVRVAMKALLAVGLAVLVLPAVVRPGARVPTLALFVGFLVPYVGYKGYSAFDDCEGCPERERFPDCSGLDFADTGPSPRPPEAWE